MNKLAAVGIFIGGATVGSLATFYISREYFRKCADDEIAAMRELYSKRKGEEEVEESEIAVPCETPEELRDYYLKQIKDLGFDIRTEEIVEDFDIRTEEIVEEYDEDIDEVNPVEYPSTIEQVEEEEFFNYDDYESTSLTLYLKDPTLVDEVDDPINDPMRYIGKGFEDLKALEAGKTYYFINHPMMLKVEVEAVDKSYED
jgi:hypothetical protein